MTTAPRPPRHERQSQAGLPRSRFACATQRGCTALLALATGLLVSMGSAVAHAPEGGNDAAAAPATCLSPANWALPGRSDGPSPAASEILRSAAEQEVVLLGEQHDLHDHHRWQLHTLAALHALRPDMVLGFESFPRQTQAVLDDWVAGKLDERSFLRLVDWEHVWGYPAELYLPLFQFARIHRIPMVALNIERDAAREVAQHGRQAARHPDLQSIGVPAAPAAEYLQALLQTFRAHAPHDGQARDEAGLDSPEFARFVAAQQLWDRAMAEVLAAARQRTTAHGTADRPPLVVGIIGSGHLRFGHGVPHQLRALGVERVHSLIPVAADHRCDTLRTGYADAVFALPAQVAPPPAPPRLGVSLSAHENGVRVVAVTADSLAEQSGLQVEDIVTHAAGQPLSSVTRFVAMVRLQPAGTWLPITVRRGEQDVDLLIKFPTEDGSHS